MESHRAGVWTGPSGIVVLGSNVIRQSRGIQEDLSKTKLNCTLLASEFCFCLFVFVLSLIDVASVPDEMLSPDHAHEQDQTILREVVCVTVQL